MWKKIKDNLDSGIAQIKWFSTLLNERLKIEVSLFRLLYQSEEMEKNKAALMKTIGERVFELRHGHERQILKDPVIAETLNKLEILNAEMEDLKKRASDIGRVEA